VRLGGALDAHTSTGRASHEVGSPRIQQEGRGEDDRTPQKATRRFKTDSSTSSSDTVAGGADPRPLSINPSPGGAVLRSACVVREAIYTAGYLGLAPVAKGRLETAHAFFENDTYSSLVSACIGGTTAAMLTHPVDTAKTCIQVSLDCAPLPPPCVVRQGEEATDEEVRAVSSLPARTSLRLPGCFNVTGDGGESFEPPRESSNGPRPSVRGGFWVGRGGSQRVLGWAV
jgi:hypothetical protein